MKEIRKNWLNNPTKKQLVLFTILWITANVLLVLSMTNFLTESVFQKKYLMLYLLMVGSTLTTFKIYRNYWKFKIN